MKSTRVTAQMLCVSFGLSVLCAAALAQELTGKGEWRSLSSDLIGGTWTATLVRGGDGVEGKMELTGSNVLSSMDVTGTIDSASVVLGVTFDEARGASFAAKLTDGKIAGEWECGALNDHGVWFGTMKDSKSSEPE